MDKETLNDSPNAVSIPATISVKGVEYTVDCIGESCEYLDHEMLCRYNSTYPRTAIDKTGFRDCGYLESIVIPDSVTTIGYLAFLGCKNLEHIVIPDSVKEIGYDPFYGCPNR
jgi:hypothetical protein